MNILIVEIEKNQELALSNELCSRIENSIRNVNIEIYQKSEKNACENFSDIDLLITFDLAGFERSTLAGGISYNLLNCKQIHFLLNRNLSNESYLSKQLSLSMFFFCSGNDYYHYLIDTYPDIPYLEPIMSQKKADVGVISVDALWLSICKVLEICKLSDAIEERNS